MGIYFDIIKFNFLRILAYPIDSFGILLRKAIEIFVLVVFWYSLSKYSDRALNTVDLISYFLIAAGISELIIGNRMKLGRNIQKMIAKGEINTYLMRPVSIIPYLYASHIGTFGIQFLLEPVYIIAGLCIRPPEHALSLVLFPLSLILAWAIALSMNILTAVIAFYIAEAGNFENVINHVISILSGSLVPLTFFPEAIRTVVELTPFPGMIFLPATTLSYSSENTDIFPMLGIALFWAIALSVITFFVWKRSIKKYEAYGI
jgi:ABC-2 type transport system permease protein